MIWRVALSISGTKQVTDYRNIEADTAEDAEKKALAMPNVRAVKWVAEPNPDRQRS